MTDPALGSWNMAVDEVLLEDAASGVATLRFYTWSEPTLSLGYFQSAASRVEHVASADCPLVRRASGGGAIMHHEELTYSLSLPASNPAAKNAESLYLAAHETLVAELGRLGICAGLNEQKTPNARADEPFLCFQRRAVGDVLFGSHKIGGSAQRRWSGSILQHGSILLRQSRFAPELPGILELANANLSALDLAGSWAHRIAASLDLELIRAESDLSPSMAERASTILGAKFGNTRWTERR